MKKTIVIASDHAGYNYKEAIKKHLKEAGASVDDVGTFSLDSCDYPIFAHEAAKKIVSGEAEYGVLVCSSGEGIAIAANKTKGIRAGIAYNDEVARLMRQHNNANMIAFGASFMELSDVIRRVDIFLSTSFEGGRHERRVNEIE